MEGEVAQGRNIITEPSFVDKNYINITHKTNFKNRNSIYDQLCSTDWQKETVFAATVHFINGFNTVATILLLRISKMKTGDPDDTN